MAKSALEKDLEKQYEEAKLKQSGEIAQAEIEVYEGQVYEAKNAYEEAKKKRADARSKLPEDIPNDPYYKERLLEAQYIKDRVQSPEQREEVDEYTAEIKKQQKAKSTIQVLDKEIPELYLSAVKESERVESKVTKAKVAEEQRQMSLLSGIQSQITVEQKRQSDVAEQKRIAEEARLQKIANAKAVEEKRILDIAQAKEKATQEIITKNKEYWATPKNERGWLNEKAIHHARIQGVSVQDGDIKYYEGGIFTDSYYNRASEILGISVAQARQVSQTGRRTQSGKSRDNALRQIQDSIDGGNRQEQYTQHRVLAKKTTASAYANMSAKEKLTSSATATMFATNHDMSASEISQKNEEKKAVQLEAISDMTGGLLGNKQSQPAEKNTMKVYEKDELYKMTQGTIGTKKDVTAEVIPIINKQREIQLANRRQQEYVKELRAGNIGTANALSSPQTTQSYTGTSTVNLGTFLKERGLTAKTAPDSMFKPDYSEKLENARAQTKVSGEMGDLRTQSGMFTGRVNQPYQMQKAGGKEIGERKQAGKRIDVFKAPIQTQSVEGSTKLKFTNLKDPIVGKTDSSKPLEQKGVSGFGVTPPQTAKDMVYDYSVVSHKPSDFPLLGGATFQAYTPVTFGTQKEADDYVKSAPTQKVFSGTDNDLWNRFQYASAVDSGEVIHPRETPTLTDDVRYYANVVTRPLVNLGASVVNMTQDRQVPIYQTGAERLIGGTIDDVASLDPMKGSGVTGAYNYVAEDPLRAVLELPAEAVMWVTGGKAVSLSVKGIGAGKTVLANAKFIPQPVKAVGTNCLLYTSPSPRDQRGSGMAGSG